MRSAARAVLVAATSLGLLLAAAPLGHATGHDGERGVIVDSRIPESSALAYSTVHRGLVYTVNDSGHPPVVYAISVRTGAVVGTARLSGVRAMDPEALAIGADMRLYVADIGDNDSNRDFVSLYRLPQPGRGRHAVVPTTFRLRYPHAAYDAEALVVDPVTERLVILTKDLASGAAYALPTSLRADRVNPLQRLPGVRVPGLVTDASAVPDADAVVVRTYTALYVYRVPGWRRVASAPLPPQRQGESLTVDPSGANVIIGSEGLPSPLIVVPLPAGVRAAPAAATASPRPGGSDRSASASFAPGPGWVLTAAGVVTVIAAVSWLASRRRQRSRATT